MELPFCPDCGKEVKDGKKFCYSCGAVLPVSSPNQEASHGGVRKNDEIPKSNDLKVETNREISAMDKQIDRSRTSGESVHSSSRKYLSFAIIAILVVALGGGLVYARSEGYIGQVCHTEIFNEAGLNVTGVSCTSNGVTNVNICASSLCAGSSTTAVQSTNSLNGLYGSNVQTVTLSSASLYAGVTESASTSATSSITLSLNNPGSATTITSLTLTGAWGGAVSIAQWSTSSSASASPTLNFGSSYQDGGPNSLLPGSVTSFTFYPWDTASQAITTGQTYNYVVNFANGQSVSGSLIAQ